MTFIYSSGIQQGRNCPRWLWVRFCDIPDLGGDFSFQGGSDFCWLEYTKIMNLFQKWKIHLPLWNQIILMHLHVS